MLGSFCLKELNYNREIKDYQKIYRIGSIISSNDNEEYITSIPGGWLNTINSQFQNSIITTKVKTVSLPHSIKLIESNEKYFNNNVIWTDSTFYSVIETNFVIGGVNPLAKKSSVLISSSEAKKRFGSFQNALGKNISISHIWATENKPINLEITGIYLDFPFNTNLKPDYIVNIFSLKDAVSFNFNDFLNSKSLSLSSLDCYIKLTNEDQLPVISKLLKKDAEFREATLDEWLVESKLVPIIKQLDQLHFDPDFEWEPYGQGDLQSIKILIIIITFILIVSTLSFIMISTAKSLRRAKEIGIQKTLGSSPLRVALNYIFEVSITVLLATLLSYILIYLSLDYFNNISNSKFTFISFFKPIYLKYLFIYLSIVILLSAIYPSLFLSKLNVIDALKSNSGKFGISKSIRKYLVISQLSISLILILYSISLYILIDTSLKDKINKLGKSILQIDFSILGQNEKTSLIRDELKNLVNIEVTISNQLPRFKDSYIISKQITFELNNKKFEVDQLNIDENFLEVFKLNIVEGRKFNKLDDKSVLISESLAKKLMIPYSDIIGTEVTSRQGQKYKILGIIEEFNITSYKLKANDLILINKQHPVDVSFYLRIKGSENDKVIEDVRKVWNKILPDSPFDYKYMDDQYKSLYKDDLILSKIILVITSFSILLTIISVYALISYVLNDMQKELLIRKIHGATSQNLIMITSKKFIFIFIISIFITLLFNTIIEYFFVIDNRIKLKWETSILAIVLLFTTYLSACILIINSTISKPVLKFLQK